MLKHFILVQVIKCMRYLNFIFLGLLLVVSDKIFAQQLKPGFDKNEFEEILKINTTYLEAKNTKEIMAPPAYSKLVYSSPVMGLENKWELWMMHDNVAVICIRATIGTIDSWTANFFAAQIPAIGEMTIAKDYTFRYKVAQNPKAAVHAGYIFCSAFLMKDIQPKIDSLYKNGIRDIIIAGHSQGGGLSYLIGANLLWQQKDGIIPADLRFKIYTSAGPKPGNLYFAYDYEYITGDGWAFQVVSTVDWVPQSPFSVQTIDDLPPVNPVPYVLERMNKESLFKKIIEKSVFNKMTKPPFKSVKEYQNYLGDYVGKRIQKLYPEFIIPKFANTNDYVRTGRQIVLQPDSAYFKKYDSAKNPSNFMLHHATSAYMFMLMRNDFN